ncbi:MraY family glycosyltransferase [Desulfonatronum thioautotrophicum]|uniref:MraY family glycosyltransferase n=1 Tax=Desulfonatronum thioautotrophicum TaxID=617001 RepID=UPI00069C10A6|nr:MraY family glycosyltransferase [Desulfonatronum thioautotrophicum]
MTTILATFLLALLLGLVLTPLAGRFGRAVGAVDRPGGRRVHDGVIPRTGGLAIFAAVGFALTIAWLWGTDVSRLIVPDRSLLGLLAGALIALGLGLYDDIFRLNAWKKLPVQILAASAAFAGGIALDKFALFGVVVFFDPVTSYLLTVFWFLLFMNALNLMDGLDGLAGGIVFFAALVMIVLALLREDYLTALFFAALAGAVLGFLRSNFHPATIFLGDAGTYFLGYAIAGFGLITSVKTHVGAAILIPVLAMGLPLLDTLLAAARRFAQGRGIFQPDSDHIHHRLLRLGLDTRKAVLLLYGLTATLCVLAIVLVNLRDERSGLLLVLIGAGAFLFAGRLGYMETLRLRCIPGWNETLLRRAEDLAPGQSPELITVLAKMENAQDLETLHRQTGAALQVFGFAGCLEMADDTIRCGTTPTLPSTDNAMLLRIPLPDDQGGIMGTLVLHRQPETLSMTGSALADAELLRRSATTALKRLMIDRSA